MGGIRHLGWLAPVAALLAMTVAPAGADDHVDVVPGEDPGLPGAVVEAETATPGASSAPSEAGVGSAGSQPTYDYQWLWACRNNFPGQSNYECGAARNCADLDAMQWTLWARQISDAQGQATPGEPWSAITTECHVVPPEVEAAPGPQVTDALVLREVRRLGLPRLQVQVQPADATLVNFETIFYAEPPEWARSVQLVGFDVDVMASPAGYTWRFGDGASAATAQPGAPYPATDVTHTYTDAHVTVAPRVDTAYEVRYRVDGGGWRTIAQTVPAAGLPAELRIREATAVLVGE